MSQDGYVRVRPGRLVFAPEVPERRDALVFVDVDLEPSADDRVHQRLVEAVLKQLRTVPPAILTQAEHLLVRWPGTTQVSSADTDHGDDQDRAAELADDLARVAGRRLPTGLVTFPIGERPRLTWSAPPRVPDAELLARARAVELEVLLEVGHGIWRPRKYHYRLPSGEHTSVFIRVADAVRTPRDAVALATWLHHWAVEDLGVIIDSATLVPIVLALHGALRAAGERPGPVVSLSEYPISELEVDRAVASLRASARLLGLLSVSSSGQTASHIQHALEREMQESRLEVVVDRRANTAAELLYAEDEELVTPPEPWLGLGREAVHVFDSDRCELCARATSARLVSIDPSSFEATVLPQPKLLMPDLNSAEEAKNLWEQYDTADAVGLRCLPPDETINLRRDDEPLEIRCFPHTLFDEDRDSAARGEFLNEVTEAAKTARLRARQEPDLAKPPKSWDPAHCDVVVTTAADGDAPGFLDFLNALANGLGRTPWEPDRIVVVEPPYTLVPDEGSAVLAEAHRVLVVTVGAMTGSTLQQLLVGVHDVTGSPVGGIIIHGRPQRRREWIVLRNAFNRRLEALWLTHLPQHSPLKEEHDTLNLLGSWGRPTHGEAAEDPFDAAADAFRDGRGFYVEPSERDWCTRVGSVQSSPVDPYAVFWGIALDPPNDTDAAVVDWAARHSPTLRPGSIFGQRCRALTTYAGVGAALQSAREAAAEEGTPLWRAFEMVAILRSYFDPLIIAAVLRWVQPNEVWWGADGREGANAIRETLARATDADRKLLIPELLLAGAQGKLPIAACQEVLLPEAKHVVDLARQAEVPAAFDAESALPWSPLEAAPVIVGLRLLEAALTRPDES